MMRKHNFSILTMLITVMIKCHAKLRPGCSASSVLLFHTICLRCICPLHLIVFWVLHGFAWCFLCPKTKKWFQPNQHLFSCSCIYFFLPIYCFLGAAGKGYARWQRKMDCKAINHQPSHRHLHLWPGVSAGGSPACQWRLEGMGAAEVGMPGNACTSAKFALVWPHLALFGLIWLFLTCSANCSWAMNTTV